jgi:carbamate kinase
VLVVAALGGNALLRRGEPLESEIARRNAKMAAEALAGIAREHRLVVTHGNGPQIGLLALQSEAYREVTSYPLDVLGAESEGMIGYLLEQELGNALPRTQIASLLTQTVVDGHDPAFSRPTKPIGPTYTPAVAQRLASERGWTVACDGRDSHGEERWRRVVASPVPLSIVERPTVELLLAHDVLVICAGGGGIPVVADAHGAHHGVEAVVDKDLATARLAEELGADLLVLLTDVPAVEVEWGTPAARPLHDVSVRELQRYRFAAGSMGPKVAAASSFVAHTGNPAAIGALADAAAVVHGTAGTIVRREP